MTASQLGLTAQEAATPSRTAMMTALARAGHLHHHGTRALLADWLAWPLVGPAAEPVLESGRRLVADQEVAFATWLAARSRLTEDWLASSGAEQYVVLGAGLDSFAWRQTLGVRVFEVDHPATQAWKRARLHTLGALTPDGLAWVPVDFETESLGRALGEAGLDSSRPTFVSWIGVLPYLTRQAIFATLRQLPRCELAVTYVPPDAARDDDSRVLGSRVEALAGSLGEPWLTLLTPADLEALLSEAGYALVDDVGAHDIHGRFGLPAMNYERTALARRAR